MTIHRFRRLQAKAIEFVSAPASPRPLAVFRIALAGVLLVQALTLSGSLLELYGRLGLAQWSVTKPMIPAGVPRVAWFADLLAPLGVSAVDCVHGFYLAYVAALACLLLGWRTRGAALAAWFTHLALSNSGSASIYGVDTFAKVGLFFCIVMPVGAVLSWDRLSGRGSEAATPGARLALRVLQIYLCIVYLASGIEKATGAQWWNGEAIWRSVMRPDLGQFDGAWLAQVPWLAMLACWSTLLVEIGYAVFVWPRWSRRYWALATIGLHVGIGVTLGLVSFSCVMIAFTLAAFLVSAEPAAAVRPCMPGLPMLNGRRVALAVRPA